MAISTGYHVFWRIFKLTKKAKANWNNPDYSFMKVYKYRFGNYYLDTMPRLRYLLDSAGQVGPDLWRRQCEIADQE